MKLVFANLLLSAALPALCMPTFNQSLAAVQKRSTASNLGTITITNLKIKLYESTGYSALSLDVSDSNSKVRGSCSGTAKISDGIQYCSPTSWSYAISQDLSSMIVNHTVHRADGSTRDRVAVWYFQDDDLFHFTCNDDETICTGVSTDAVSVNVNEYAPHDALFGDLATK